MTRRALLFALGLGACCGCSETTPTQVIVQLYVEPELAASATKLSVTVENDDGALVLERVKELDGASGRIARIPLIPKGDDPTRRFIVRAELSDGITLLGKIEARAGYREEELRTLNLWFTEVCSDKTACGDGRTCNRGTCRGACFDTLPAEATEPSEPSCTECEQCLVRCEATEGAKCGCEGDTCRGNQCEPAHKVRFVAAGWEHTCAVLTSDQVYCWGTSAGLGAGWPSPVPLPNGEVGSLGVALGVHGCALSPSTRSCWGPNNEGQLGDGTIALSSAHVALTNASPSLDELNAGFNHTCGLTNEGEVWCWGQNHLGQLGIGNASTTGVPTPQPVGSGYAKIVAGGNQSCGLKTDRTLWCWGNNEALQVGVSARTAITAPVQAGCDDPSSATCFHDWTHVGMGGWVTCGIREGGRLYCWGANVNGSRGTGPPYEENEVSDPMPVGEHIRWSRVDGGGRHTCGLDLDNRLYCWGLNDDHQLGFPGVADKPTHVDADAPSGWADLSLGRLHSCAIRDDRTLWCWGRNAEGQTGTNSSAAVLERPTRVCF